MEKTKEILQWICKQPEYKNLPVENPYSLFYHTAPITFARFIERYLNECVGESSDESAALLLHIVSQQRELLLAFKEYCKNSAAVTSSFDEDIEGFLKNNNCG